MLMIFDPVSVETAMYSSRRHVTHPVLRFVTLAECLQRKELAPERSACLVAYYLTGGKSTSVLLMRLKVFVNTVNAMANVISTSCASV